MSEIKPIKLANGLLYVETEDVDLPPLPEEKKPTGTEFEDTPEDAELVGFKEDIQETAVMLRSMISALATDVAQSLRKAAPAEWTLEFNIGFKGKTTPIPILLSSEANAAIKLTAKWKQRENDK